MGRRQKATVSPATEYGVSPPMQRLAKTSETYAQNLTDNLNLQEARWAEHRKKIGLSKRQRFSKQQLTENPYDQIKRGIIEFVKDKFRRKECIRFVPKNDPKRKETDPIKCLCGETPERHVKHAAGVAEFFKLGVEEVSRRISSGQIAADWNAANDIVEMETNAYGKIDFVYEGLGGRKPSKYVRLKDDTPIDSVIDMFENHWHMKSPYPANLVITVIGGAKNFKLDGKKKEIFNRGLVNAAQTTHAWIITSGFNMGVMRAVGEAVAEAQSYTWDKNGLTHTLRCIGIAPWGYVLDRKWLASEDSEGCWNASYKSSKLIRHGSPVSLNPNHTHFLLVDDGHRNRYDGVAEFRARLERKLSLPSNPSPGEDSGCGIPVVLLVVEGGYDAINDVHRSIKAKIPCVICEGTGRAADILAYAYTHFVTTRDGQRMMKDKHKVVLEDKLINAYGKTWAARSDVKKEAAKFMKIVNESCENENLMTVFDMNKHDELDLSILSALLKGQAAKNMEQIRDQLRLALTWNRTDIAEEEIFALDMCWPAGSLNDIMTDALLEDKVGFVRLLLQNGLLMEEYLTPPTLRMLYNKVPKTTHLYRLLQDQTKYAAFTLKDVAKVLSNLLGKFRNETYTQDSDNKSVEKDLQVSVKDDKACKFENPIRELFLWAVLNNRQELAKFLWERGEEALPSAIAASKIYGSLTEVLPHYESDQKATYMKNKEEFETLAVKVLDECNNIDPEKAAMLIERKYPGWGGMDCLEMAAQAEDMEFLSTVCCQNSLNLSWKRGISSHSFLIPICLIFPPLIFGVLGFQSIGENNAKLTPQQKFVTFFKAPVTKFAANLLMYILFLGLYSYMILFRFREEITIEEWIVNAWIISMSMEEIREMFFSSMGETLKQTLTLWWNFSVFNRLDLLVIILALMAIIFRLTPGPILWAKNVYAINCVFLFVRLLREYSASSSLGPKLVMIKEMLKELVFFITILVVFLLAYGIASQSLMYPVREVYSFTLVLKDILYYPYWQVYGELYLEEIEGRTEECLNNGTMMADGTPCPRRGGWLVITMTAFYLLVGNLLLLNILIAIFNNVFNEIHAHSIQIWKYGIYFLVVEYDNKPTLAPPFVVIEHFIIFIRWIYRKTCKKEVDVDQQYSEQQVELLELFEKEMVRAFVKKRNVESKDSMLNHVTRIHHRVDEMAKLMEEERLLEQQHFEAEQNKIHSGGRTHPPIQSPASVSASSISSRGSNHGNSNASPMVEEKKFQRWPSLERIKELKEGMGVIHEVTSGQETDLNMSVPPTLSFDEQGRYSSTPEHAKPLLGTTESETDNRWHQRSIIPLREVSHDDPVVSIQAPGLPSAPKSADDQVTDPKDSGKDKSPGAKKKLKYKRKSSKRSSAEGHDLLRVFQSGYSKLSEDSSSEKDMLPLSPVHRAIAERHLAQIPSPQLQQVGSEEVKSKLALLEERLVGLEENTQKSLGNIQALLQNIVLQQGAPPAEAPAAAWTPPAFLPPPLTMSSSEVPPPIDHMTSLQNNFSVPDVMHRQGNTFQGSTQSMYQQHPVALTQRPSSAGYPTRGDLPPTHPPTRAFQSFDDLV